MNTKDAFYFPHDSNAKDDPKCVLVIDQMGPEGYGIYWILVETLRDQPGYQYPMNLLPALARRYNTTAEKVITVVKSYGLFTIEDDKIFFSESLIKRMIPLEDKKATAKKAAQIRWEKYKSNADAMQTHSECNAEAMPIRREESRIEESKGKESKGEENNKSEKPKRFIPPTLSEVQDYISSNSYSVNPEAFINHYTSNGWMVGKNKMKDWKAAVRTWHQKNDQKKSEFPQATPTVTNVETSKKDYSSRF